MILVKIIVDSPDEADEAVSSLLKEKLIFDAFVSPVELHYESDTQLLSSKKITIQARTKAVLFEHLRLRIQELFPAKEPVLLAVPIIYMDAIQSEKLKKHTGPLP